VICRVGIGEYRVARSPVVLKAAGLGSCLAISLFDPGLLLGGLAHTLLPVRQKVTDHASPAKYVDEAIHLMLRELIAHGAAKRRLVAKLAGGANMFEAEFLSLVDGIGARSAHSARQVLAELELPLIAEDVGGNRGRSVEFDLATGHMRVYCARGNTTISL
jgi:chemotaxis protein CheD